MADIEISGVLAAKIAALPFHEQAVALILLEAQAVDCRSRLCVDFVPDRVEVAYRQACSVFGWRRVQDAVDSLVAKGILAVAV